MNSLEISKELLSQGCEEKIERELLIIKGCSLIELRELEEGKELLLSLMNKIDDKERKQKLMIQIAFAEFDLNNYEKAFKISHEILNTSESDEVKADCFNLFGWIEYYKNNDLDKSLEHFHESLKLYEKSNQSLQEVKLEGNIGNIYNIKGDSQNAEKYWNLALNKNLSIGNLDQEAIHQLNYGVYYYDNLEFEKSVKQYERSLDIFSSLGNKNGQILVLNNLGEVNLIMSNYQESFNALTQARIICKQLNNPEEEAAVLFTFGKFYNSLGDLNSLKKIITEYEKILNENNLPERHKNTLQYLKYYIL